MPSAVDMPARARHSVILTLPPPLPPAVPTRWALNWTSRSHRAAHHRSDPMKRSAARSRHYLAGGGRLRCWAWLARVAGARCALEVSGQAGDASQDATPFNNTPTARRDFAGQPPARRARCRRLPALRQAATQPRILMLTVGEDEQDSVAPPLPQGPVAIYSKAVESGPTARGASSRGARGAANQMRSSPQMTTELDRCAAVGQSAEPAATA